MNSGGAEEWIGSDRAKSKSSKPFGAKCTIGSTARGKIAAALRKRCALTKAKKLA
jgi:hypothetical protein